MVMTVDERNKIIMENQPLIHYLLKPYRNPLSSIYSYEDLVQVANMAALHAIDQYDGESCKLSSYMGCQIRWAVHLFVKKNCSSWHVPERDYDAKQLPTVVSMDNKVLEDIPMHAVVGRCDDVDFMMLLDAVERICKKDKENGEENFKAWKLWRIGGYKQHQIASMMGLSRPALGMRMNKIEGILRKTYKR